MGAITAHFRARDQHLEPEMALDLLAQTGEGLAVKLFHLAAAKAHDVRMFLFRRVS
jgi:hypothetical protein